MAVIDLVTMKSFLEPLELAQQLWHTEPGNEASSLDGPTTNANIEKAVLAKHAELIP